MIEPQTDIQQDVDRVEISDELIDLIIDKMVDDMTDKIGRISPDDDPSAEYDEYWTTVNGLNIGLTRYATHHLMKCRMKPAMSLTLKYTPRMATR